MLPSSTIGDLSLRSQKRRPLAVCEQPPPPRELIDAAAELRVEECEGEKHPTRREHRENDCHPHRCNPSQHADRKAPACGEAEVHGPEEVARDQEDRDDVEDRGWRGML